jgi:hypothetical protein
VGAGDVFFASYLAAHLYRKLDIDLAATFAAGVAAKQVRGRHLAPGLLDLGGKIPEKERKREEKQQEPSSKGGKQS